MSALGEKIKELRERRGMKQVDLAGIVDVHVSRISQWETGARKVSFPTAAKLAHALGVKIDELVPSALEAERQKQIA